MPQIAQLAATYSSQIFWLLVTFGFVFFIVGRGMVPKVQSTVEARDRKIADDLAAAKASFAHADTLEADWRDRENASRASAQEVLVEAKGKATRETEAHLAEADRGIADRISAAEAAVDAARMRALSDIETETATLAAQVVERVAGASVSPQAATEAAKVALANG